MIFRISRFKPGVIDPPVFQNFSMTVAPGMTVLDCLERIRLEQDGTLVYRHSCHHSSCGTCGLKINRRERLACVTRVIDLEKGPITLEPLSGFRRIADLAVEMTVFFKPIDADWDYRKPAEPMAGPTGAASWLQFENCIECGLCVSSCPAVCEHPAFMGPAAMAALDRQLAKHPEAGPQLLARAGGPNGEKWCSQALNCSRVCPVRVYPARHIADLRRRLGKALAR
jgi:succinate dehydrogenase / fumarate reductase iron-sulfur subunit